MRRLLVAVAALLFLSSAFSCLAEPVKEPKYSSEKPRYVKVAVTEDGSKVLTVVFDETTGETYDVLYADVDFSGGLEKAKKVQAKVHKCSPTGIHSDFPPVKLNVPYNEKAAGVADPCEIRFNYAKHWYTTRVESVKLSAQVLSRRISKTVNPSLSKTTTNENFYAFSTIRLRGSAQWQYSFMSPIKPSENLEKAPVWRFSQTPQLKLTAKADPRKKENLGIALALTAGEANLECKKEEAPAKAYVEVKSPEGKVVHRDDGPLSKFGFG